jgi:hypothetical protein
MSFPPSVKQQALVLSARHCCSCHRYRGVKLELHHIQQQSQGGPDTIENAAVLCFDCHTDAGHYNPNHPKGTRFSPEEIKLARDNWYKQVRLNNIQAPLDANNAIHCSYIVVRSLDVINDIFEKRLDELPFSNPLLLENDIFRFWFSKKSAVDAYFDWYRTDGYNSPEKYLELYPDARITNYEREVNSDYYRFSAYRLPTKRELIQNQKELYMVNKFLVHHLIDYSNHIKAHAFFEECGGSGEIDETVEFRPTWMVLMKIENCSQEPLRINGLSGRIFENIVKSYGDDSSTGKEYELPMPELVIKKDQCILIPLYLAKAPFEENRFDEDEVLLNSNREVYLRTYCLTSLSGNHNLIDIVGDYLELTNIEYQIGDQPHEVEPHKLDFGKLYTIDADLQCGSCPHLFFENNEALIHQQELFTFNPGEFETIKFTVPAGIEKMVIAEIEDEQTEIAYIKVNNKILVGQKVLNNGDHLVIDVSEGCQVEIKGRYISEWKTNNPDTRAYRNKLIHRFVQSWSNQLTS